MVDEDAQEERLSAAGVLQTFGRLSLHTLEVYGSQYRYNVPWGASLQRLLDVPLRTTLTALTFHHLLLPPEQCAIIKQLPLRRLSVLRTWSDDDGFASYQIPQEWTVEQLAALCTPPHALAQLEEFSITPPQLEGGTMRHPLTGAHLDLLQHLPLVATTALTPRQYTRDCLDRLHHFSHLAELSLDSCADQHAATFEAVVEGVRRVISLVELTLGRVTLQDAAMRLLLSSLPNLATLELKHSSSVDGLVCFADAGRSFASLWLTSCENITYAHLCELRGSCVPASFGSIVDVRRGLEAGSLTHHDSAEGASVQQRPRLRGAAAAAALPLSHDCAARRPRRVQRR